MVIFIPYFRLMAHARHRKSFLGLFFGLGSVRARRALTEPNTKNRPKKLFLWLACAISLKNNFRGKYKRKLFFPQRLYQHNICEHTSENIYENICGSIEKSQILSPIFYKIFPLIFVNTNIGDNISNNISTNMWAHKYAHKYFHKYYN